MKRYIKNGKILPQNRIVITTKVGKKVTQIISPSEELILADGWEVYTPPQVEPYTPSYEELVEQFIREKYSVSNELAILRQKDVKQEEYQAYFAYCEECKGRAKSELNQAN